MGVMLSAGGSFKWFREQCAQELTGQPDASSKLNEEAAAVARGADGVVFLPYLQGERTPHRDAAMRAAFLGLSGAHTRAHLTRAVLEGICFGLRDSLSILQQLGRAPDHLLLTGGGAKSPFVRQLLAEIFGLPVATVNREEGPAYGAALLGAVGAGAFPDVPAAARATLRRSAPEQPESAAVAKYQVLYGRFRNCYAAGRPDRLG
jgi:xylulokinase